MRNRTIFEVLFELVFDRAEVQFHRVAKWDEQPWIFVSIEIVGMDLSRVQFDLVIPNNN